MSSLTIVGRILPSLVLLAFLTAGEAATITIPSVADTSLFELNPTHNLGATEIVAGTLIIYYPNTARGLLKFDIRAHLPEGSVINSASLKVWVVMIPNDSRVNDYDFDLRRMLVSWSEGNKTGVTGMPASTGEATWNSSSHSNTLWSVPGGTEYVDYSATVSSSVFISGPVDYTFNSTPVMVGDVQNWLDNPAANFGWMMKNRDEGLQGTARRFGARHSGLTAPSLTINFTPPAPLPLTLSSVSNELFQFSFPAQSNTTYTVQVRDSLQAGSWSTLTNIPAPSATTNIFITDLLSNTSRFYRVKSP